MGLLRSASLLIVSGVNAALLADVAVQVMSDGLAASDKVDWSANLLGAVANTANRRSLETYGQILAGESA
jgi:hypothetical protein